MRTLTPIALSAVLLASCIEPDLGDVPFYCNKGDPECPDGYQCVANRCVREGVSTTDANGVTEDQGEIDGPVSDSLMPWPESSPWPDTSTKVDAPPMKLDLGILPDAPKPKTDGWPPHLGCQSHAECASDPSNPCCCPMPLLPQIWACLPLCLNPFCI